MILIAAPSLYYRGWSFPRNLLVLLGTQLAYIISLFLGYFPGRILGFGGRESRGVIRDWSRNAFSGTFRPEGIERDAEKLLGELEARVFAFSIEGDWLAPEKAVKNLLKKLKNSRIEHLHLIPRDQGTPSMNHFNWVDSSGSLADAIVEWISAG